MTRAEKPESEENARTEKQSGTEKAPGRQAAAKVRETSGKRTPVGMGH